MPKKSPQAAEGRRPGAAEDAEPGEAGRSLYLCSTNNCMKETAAHRKMNQTAAQQETKLTAAQRKTLQYDDDNAIAALIILSDPNSHAGLRLEWAQATANRLVTQYPGRYLALGQVWAQAAYQLAFREFDPSRGDPSESELDELADLRAWLRR